jgi:hypothetical protein
MPILTRQRLMCAKVESTLGTPEDMTVAATGAMNILDMSRSPSTPFTETPAQNGLGKRKGIAGARMGTMQFSLHMVGLGSSGLPYWANLLGACGGAYTSQTFAPVVDNGTGATLGLFRGASTTARLFKMAGAMGNAVMRFVAGEVCPIQFTFTGKIYTATTATLPTVTHPTALPPRFVSGTLTVGGTTFVVDELEFDMGNVVVMRQDGTDTSNSGYISAWIADRAPRVRISPEALGLATKDWDADFFASNTAALSVVLGGTANNIITLAAPAMQLVTPPSDGDRNGIYTDVLEFNCNQNSDTEDSEYTIAFS